MRCVLLNFCSKQGPFLIYVIFSVLFLFFFRYFVKTYSNDFDSEAVYEEIKEDNRELPVYEGKILVKIERKDDLDSSKHSSGSEKKYQI